MKEALTRRYTRLLEEGKTLPQLIVVDGGKGQLSAAVEALKAIGVYGKLAIVGIAKRLEEIYYPGDPLPMYIDKKSETLKVIQHMRDEAHRFAITFHRSRRSKVMLESILDEIPQLGAARRASLLDRFGSVAAIRKASVEDIAATPGIGSKIASIIESHLSSIASQSINTETGEIMESK